MLKNFVSNDRFYNSIGLREIFDLKAQKAKSAQERDRFYFDNAMAEMERHFKASKRPLFTFIQTMSAHWPYDFAFEPHVDVPGGGPGTDPEMHEYLRRVSMAKIDYDYLLGELQRRFPGERFLIVHYGDHHPMATRTLLGYKSDTEAEDVVLDPESIGFITYYAAQGINYRVPALPPYETLDVSYLGSVDTRPRRPAALRFPSRAHAAHGIVPGALLQLRPARGDPALPPPPDQLRRSSRRSEFPLPMLFSMGREG